MPGMRELDRDTLLFVNGGSAVRPHPGRAGTSIAFAAESACARLLHDSLAPENIHAAQRIIPGAIRPDAEHSSPDVLAQRLYDIHSTGEHSMNPTYDFSGQVALVTGAGSGMGLATTRAFAEAGAAVALTDIDDATLNAAARELTDEGHRVLALPCDVSDEGQVAAAVDRTVETFGRLDMAYNNAGIQIPPSDAADEPAERFDRVNAINLRGVWAAMKHELRHMRAQGSGAIVNCSSLGGLVGIPGRASYHASKHGGIGLTTSAALEYAPRGIRINAVCPGTIDTPMVSDMITKGELDRAEAEANQPINRLGTADEIAQAVLWLCSPGAGFVVGVALPVDGGYVAR